MNNHPPINFQKLFESLPGNYLILYPDFTIAAVSDAYAAATKTVRENIVGKGIFKVFPDDPNDPSAHGVENLTASLNRVLDYKKPDKMALQKYNIPKPDGTGFEERYWDPQNSPLLIDGQVVLIIHYVTDVTHKVLTDKNLEEKVRELELMNEAMVGREVKMVELKKRIEELENLIKKNNISLPG
jgi:PAS domain-containing protein